MSNDLSSLGDRKFVSLTTFKKSGEGWRPQCGWREGNAFVMWSPADGVQFHVIERIFAPRREGP